MTNKTLIFFFYAAACDPRSQSLIDAPPASSDIQTTCAGLGTDQDCSKCGDVCDTGSFCYESACTLKDACTITFGLPCDAFAAATLEGTSALDQFGYAVALHENTMVIGAPGEASLSRTVNGPQTEVHERKTMFIGAAYVFARTDEGWILQAYLKASNSHAPAFFGGAVSIFGDLIAVGSRGESSEAIGVNGADADTVSAAAQQSGAVYLFRRNTEGQWAQEAHLKRSVVAPMDQLGFRVLAGDGFVVAASYSGLYTFESTPTGWRERGVMDGVTTLATVGLAMTGNWLAIAEENTADGDRYIVIFERISFSWIQVGKIVFPNPFGAWGYSLAIDARTGAVMVGLADADNSDVGTAIKDSGVVLIYERDVMGDWIQTTRLRAADPQPDDRFGSALALNGKLFVVGAAGRDTTYLFEADTKGVWRERATLQSTASGENFGEALAFDGSTLVIGAPSSNENAGSAYVRRINLDL